MLSRTHGLAAFVYFVILTILTGSAIAVSPGAWDEDDYSWTGFTGIPGIDGAVYAMAEFQGRLYVGGTFDHVGPMPIVNLARWDGATWDAPFTLGGINHVQVRSLLSFNDELVVGTSNGIYRYDGVNWDYDANNLQGRVECLAKWNGWLIAGGNFWYGNQDDTVLHNIAYYSGSRWHPFGIGTDGDVKAIADFNGGLIIAGHFANADGHTADSIASWNGSTFWHLTYPGPEPGAKVLAPDIEDLLVNDGSLYVTGDFTSLESFPMNYLARWDGVAWSEVGGGLDAMGTCLDTLNGAIFVGGDFQTAGGIPAARAAIFDGAIWTTMDGGLDHRPYTTAEYDGAWYVGGWFVRPGGTLVSYSLAIWNEIGWNAPPGTEADGIYGNVQALVQYDGRLVAGGSFHTAGSLAVDNLAAWDGFAWTALGGSGPDDWVESLTVWNGLLVAAGRFATVGGAAADGLALWDGLAWSEIGSVVGDIYAMTVHDGDLAIGGDLSSIGGIAVQNVALYDGLAWNDLGGGIDDEVYTLLSHDGLLLAGGDFLTAGRAPASRLAAWDGTAWSEYADGADGSVNALGEYDGDLIAGGYFDTIGGVSSRRIARLAERGWEPLGECFVGEYCIATGPDSWDCWDTGVEAISEHGGKLFVTGSIMKSGSLPTVGIACWDDIAEWSALGSGISEGGALCPFGTALYVATSRAGGMERHGLGRWLDPNLTDVRAPGRVILNMGTPTPNPCNPATSIGFELATPVEVTVALFDLRGRSVRRLIGGPLDAGHHEVVWNGQDDDGIPVASGVYLAIVEGGGERVSHKIVLAK
ncbi:hypothetical protein H8E07_06440 [bacterium]|nr:hypothetical protein [bacterium]